jgi:hypothetical protein
MGGTHKRRQLLRQALGAESSTPRRPFKKRPGAVDAPSRLVWSVPGRQSSSSPRKRLRAMPAAMLHFDGESRAEYDLLEDVCELAPGIGASSVEDFTVGSFLPWGLRPC